MQIKKNIVEVINYLVANKLKFAICSEPMSNDIKLVLEFDNLGSSSFIVQPFDFNAEPMSISGDIFLKNEDIRMSNIDFSLLEFHTEQTDNKINFNCFSQQKYETYVSDTVAECRKGNIVKGVCARLVKVSKPNDFNIGEYFLKLVENHHSAFTNLYYHNDCGLWIGATPELLVRKSGVNNFETVSLAGTKLKSKNREWTNKEIVEQQIVTDYIKNVLIQMDSNITNDTKAISVDAGHMQHLKSIIKFSSNLNLKSISKKLHPTPAICGMPKKESFALIKEYEVNQRQNYAGFVGLVGSSDEALYVNLRCMQVIDNNFFVYVGAGITKDSIPEKEWQETNNKMQTLMDLV